MRLRKRREWVYKYPIHVCIWDKDCRAYGAPRRIYLHFLDDGHGYPVVIDFDKEN